MLEHLPLIVFLVTFVLIFVLRMPIPAGMIAACTLYFLTDGLIKGVGFGALITGAAAACILWRRRPSKRYLPTAPSSRYHCLSLPRT